MFLWNLKPIPLLKILNQKIYLRKKNTFRRSEAMIKKIFNCLPTCGFGCLVYILEPTKKLFYRQHFK